MKKSTLFNSSLNLGGILAVLVLVTSCANELKFVKVKSNEPVYVQKTETVNQAEETEMNSLDLTTPAEPENTVAYASPEAYSSPVQANSLTGEQEQTSTRELVRAEMAKYSVFTQLTAAQHEKVEKLIEKRAEKVMAKKKVTPASAASVAFTRIMVIGLIILLIGVLLGALVGGWGWIFSVVGLGLIIYGLIVQI